MIFKRPIKLKLGNEERPLYVSRRQGDRESLKSLVVIRNPFRYLSLLNGQKVEASDLLFPSTMVGTSLSGFAPYGHHPRKSPRTCLPARELAMADESRTLDLPNEERQLRQDSASAVCVGYLLLLS